MMNRNTVSFINYFVRFFLIFFSIIFAQKVETRDEIIEDLQGLINNNQFCTIYVIVALCDNESQGIVPVAAKLGNGEDPEHNLYWGANFGVKTFFKNSKNWHLIKTISNLNENILERCVFKKDDKKVYLIADAYRGSKIKDAVEDFLRTASGDYFEEIQVEYDSLVLNIDIGEAQLIVYVGHNGLMDFELDEYQQANSSKIPKDVIILACASKFFFAEVLENINVFPLLWTKGLCAPEAYTLEAAIEGWLNLEDCEQIRTRVATAYKKYQKCGLKAAKLIFITGW